MIFEGLKLMAIRLAVQYGDGQALAAFWKDGMINYTRGKKVHRRKKVVPKQIDLSKQLKLSATFGDGRGLNFHLGRESTPVNLDYNNSIR